MNTIKMVCKKDRKTEWKRVTNHVIQGNAEPFKNIKINVAPMSSYYSDCCVAQAVHVTHKVEKPFTIQNVTFAEVDRTKLKFYNDMSIEFLYRQGLDQGYSIVLIDKDNKNIEYFLKHADLVLDTSRRVLIKNKYGKENIRINFKGLK